MMRPVAACLCLLFGVAVLATASPTQTSPTPSPRLSAAQSVLRSSSWKGVPRGWKSAGDASQSELMSVVVAVKQRNVELLERRLLEVSDPDSALYGQHLAKEDVSRLLSPAPASIAAVVAWFQDFGVEPDQLAFSDNGDFISAEIETAAAEKMLQVRFVKYLHEASGTLVVRSDRPYSLPAYVHPHVDFVTPAGGFPSVPQVRIHPRPRMVRQSAAGDEALSSNSIGGTVTPAFLRQLYGINNYTATNPDNVQACASFLDQFYAPSDLEIFFQQFDPQQSGRQPVVYGPNNASDPGIEASLDIQYLMALGNNVSTQFWSTNGTQPKNPENEPFLVWLLNVEALPDRHVPKTISVSYGDNEDTVDFDYAKRVNVEFQKLGVRGVSIMFSSGDGGVAGGQTSFCPNGTFIPTFPAASPWVTAVGGTGQSNPEVAASFSSGGFSNYWERPAWQENAVKGYLSTASNLPPSTVYNAPGRAFPDVSAQAESFNVIQAGSVVPFGVYGTSCSAPAFAGIVSLLNDARLNAGKKPLGFLNPLIYKNPHLFNDITSGSNPGCNSNGFYAAAGWDPVTGMGTPNFPALLSYVLSLP